tara:strand:- start:65 stop:301 length:237 start_codon:yes stop_codon:yes gene_type:complete
MMEQKIKNIGNLELLAPVFELRGRSISITPMKKERLMYENISSHRSSFSNNLYPQVGRNHEFTNRQLSIRSIQEQLRD